MPSIMSLIDMLPNGGGDGKAFESLTLESMRDFNKDTPDVDGVQYFSWGADYGRLLSVICPTLLFNLFCDRPWPYRHLEVILCQSCPAVFFNPYHRWPHSVILEQVRPRSGD